MRPLIVLIVVILVILIIIWMVNGTTTRSRHVENTPANRLKMAASLLSDISDSTRRKVETPLTPDRLIMLLRDPSTKEAIMAKFSDKGDLANGETFITIMLDHLEGLIAPKK